MNVRTIMEDVNNCALILMQHSAVTVKMATHWMKMKLIAAVIQ